jgi:transcriptional regulator with GAF, ATPase, and Fis domain
MQLYGRTFAAGAELGTSVRDKLVEAGIIGSSPVLRRILDELQTVAPTDSTVLILGQTGTGRNSLRARFTT